LVPFKYFLNILKIFKTTKENARERERERERERGERERERESRCLSEKFENLIVMKRRLVWQVLQ
jgi:hypothetical protein